MHILRPSLFAALVLICACSDRGHGSRVRDATKPAHLQHKAPDVQVHLNPNGRATGVVDGVVHIEFDTDAHIGAPLLEFSHLVKYTDGSGRRVDYDLLVSDAAPLVRPTASKGVDARSESMASPARPSIAIIPRVPLNPEWHVIVVGPLPGGFSSGLPNASFLETQLRPDGRPMARAVRLCAKGEEVRIIMEMSESVHSVGGLSAATFVILDGRSCTCIQADELAAGRQLDSLEFTCAGAWDQGEVSAVLAPSLRGSHDLGPISTAIAHSFGPRPASGQACLEYEPQ